MNDQKSEIQSMKKLLKQQTSMMKILSGQMNYMHESLNKFCSLLCSGATSLNEKQAEPDTKVANSISVSKQRIQNSELVWDLVTNAGSSYNIPAAGNKKCKEVTHPLTNFPSQDQIKV